MSKHLILFLLLFIIGCAAQPILQSHHASTSEATGVGVNKFGIGIRQGYKMFFAPSFNTTVVQDTRTFSETTAFVFDYTRGIFPWLDFETQLGANVPAAFMLKFQPLGEPTSSAGAGNLSLSFKLGTSLYVAGDKANAFSSSGALVERKYIVSGYINTFGFFLGYRIFAPLNVYFAYVSDSVGIATRFIEGDLDGQRIRISATNLYSLLGVEYKIENFLVSLNLSTNSIEVDEDSSANKDELNFSLNSSYMF